MVNKYVSSVLTLLSIRISASHSKYLYPVEGYKYILDGLHLVSNIYLVDIIWRHFLSVVMSQILHISCSGSAAGWQHHREAAAPGQGDQHRGQRLHQAHEQLLRVCQGQQSVHYSTI